MTPAGAFETGATSIPLRITGALDGVAAVEAVPVAVGDRVFRLGDIATVTRGLADPPASLVREDGRPAIGVGVSMVENGNIIALGHALDAAMAGIEADLPVGLTVDKIADQPVVVEHSIHEFVKSFAEALGIVLLVSFLSLGLRTGMVVALSVPLVLAIVFFVMSLMGMDLNRITLGALIIALGLLVDDAIIAIEMMVVKTEAGWDRARAAGAAWDITAFPMLTGTLVTAAGFIPVGFAASAVAEYAGGIFWVVAIALIVSWFVAVIFTPYLGVMLLPRRAAGGARSLRQPDLPAAAGGDRRLPPAPAQGDRGDGGDLRGGDPRLRQRAAAVLPDLRAAGALPADQAAGGVVDHRDDGGGRGGGGAARGRRGRAARHRLCRAGQRALLARAEPAAAEPVLRRDRDPVEGHRGARADQGAAGAGGRRRRAQPRRGCGSTASTSGRRSGIRCSSA